MTAPFDVVGDAHDREQWLAQRRATIGASEAAVVLGCSPWSSQLALWAEKTGQVERDPEHDSAEWLFWGQQLEPAIIEGYAKRTGRTTVPFGLSLRSREWPWLSATPDALVTDDPEAAKRMEELKDILCFLRSIHIDHYYTDKLNAACAGWWPLQTKNIGFGSAEHWAEGVPLYYRVQCAQEALVFGAPRTTGAALIAGQRLAWDDVDVTRDGLLERQIVNLTRLFVREHIEPQIAPGVDASESARQTLAALFPRETPEKVVLLGSAWMDLADIYDGKKAAKRALEGELRTFENQIRQEMADAERCVFPDGSGFTLKCAAHGARTLLRKKAKGD